MYFRNIQMFIIKSAICQVSTLCTLSILAPVILQMITGLFEIQGFVALHFEFAKKCLPIVRGVVRQKMPQKISYCLILLPGQNHFCLGENQNCPRQNIFHPGQFPLSLWKGWEMSFWVQTKFFDSEKKILSRRMQYSAGQLRRDAGT